MISLQNLVARAAKINREVDRSVKDFAKCLQGIDDENERNTLTEQWTSKTILKKQNEYIRDIKTALQLRDAIRSLEEETGETLLFVPQGSKQAYFITIRPDTKKIKFCDFYNDVRKFCLRKCFETFKLSFEQKGMSDDTLGDGFHVHIVACMKQRSKGEVLRDTISAFKGYTAPNCIEVLTTRNPDELVDNYLVNYKSDDGHKAPTQKWDALWRTQENLEGLYSGSMPIKSVSASTTKAIKTTITFN